MRSLPSCYLDARTAAVHSIATVADVALDETHAKMQVLSNAQDASGFELISKYFLEVLSCLLPLQQYAKPSHDCGSHVASAH